MKPFNVTMIHQQNYLHSQALKEVTEYVHWSLVQAGYGSTMTINRIDSSAHNVVLCGHLLEARELELFPADTIMFNSEQLQAKDSWYFKGAYKQFLDKFYVWDYSLKNLPLLGHDRVGFIPFLFCPDLVRPDIPRVPGKALSFYGSNSPRRIEIYYQIRAAGVPLELGFAKYGAERDMEMFKAWAVLNLRQFDEMKLFEPVRCFYPLTNGIPIISEAAPQDPTFEYYKDWIFSFDTADLAPGIAKLYQDPAAFTRAADEKIAAFRATSSAEAMKDVVERYLEVTQ